MPWQPTLSKGKWPKMFWLDPEEFAYERHHTVHVRVFLFLGNLTEQEAPQVCHVANGRISFLLSLTDMPLGMCVTFSLARIPC